MNGFEEAFAPLRGFYFADEESRTNALWLALWLHKMAAQPAAFLRVPLVVIEGPTQSGKNALLQRLAEAAGCQGIGFHDSQFPPRESVLTAIAKSDRLMWVFDNPKIIGRRGVCQQERWDATEHFLTSTLYMEKPRKGQAEGNTHVLHSVIVVLAPGPVELSPDMERRAIRIRLQARTSTSAR